MSMSSNVGGVVVEFVLAAASVQLEGMWQFKCNWQVCRRSRVKSFCVAAVGQDVARLVADQAAAVYLCAREWTTQQQLDAGSSSMPSNMQRRGMITQLTPEGEQHMLKCMYNIFVLGELAAA
jgi:hypothetical protein